MSIKFFQEITQILRKLPYIGNRGAEKLMLYFLQNRESTLMDLENALKKIKEKIVFCEKCGFCDATNPCFICKRPGGHILCIVPCIEDLFRIEKTQCFHGHYHILGGILMTEDFYCDVNSISVQKLLQRVQPNPGHQKIEEIIFAFGGSPEAEIAKHQLHKKILEVNPGVKITELSYGMPFGGEIHNVGNETLSCALMRRYIIKGK